MKILGKRRTRSAVLLAAAISLVYAGASPASAAPDYNDPYVSRCAKDAYAVGAAQIQIFSPTIDRATFNMTGNGYVHLMHSPKCNTNWAEFDGYPRGYMWVLAIWNHAGSYHPTYWTSVGDEIAWTDMVDASYGAGVGVCLDSVVTGEVFETGYLIQHTTGYAATFSCQPDQWWTITGP